MVDTVPPERWSGAAPAAKAESGEPVGGRAGPPRPASGSRPRGSVRQACNRSEPPRQRVLVAVIPADDGDALSLLRRMPASLLARDSVEFLSFADPSADKAQDELWSWIERHGRHRFTVLHRPEDRGHGVCCKLACLAGIRNGDDFVVLVRSDAVCSPGVLVDMLDLRSRAGADIVLASSGGAGAVTGVGDPASVPVRSPLLARVLSRLTGVPLDGFPLIALGCSTALLESVPFESNTDGALFEFELLLQAAHCGEQSAQAQVRVAPGPVAGTTSGLADACRALCTALRFRLHRIGVFCLLKYRSRHPSRYEDKTDSLYTSHLMALDVVRQRQPSRLLDIGCGPGFVARRCEQLGVEVTGMDVVEPASGMMMTHFVWADLEKAELPVRLGDYDMALLLDVIEHLAEPEDFLFALRDTLSPELGHQAGPLLVLTTPNVAFVGIRVNLLFGRFSYAERGILDITHRRLFTRSSLLRALRDCGYAIERVVPVAVPFEAVIGGRLGRVLGIVGRTLAGVWPTMFAFQFMVLCRPRVGYRQLLDRYVAPRHAVLAEPSAEPGCGEDQPEDV